MMPFYKKDHVVGLRGKVLVAKGVASVRSCEKLPPCLIEPVPASSAMDPLLAKVLWFGCGQQQKRHAAALPPAAVRRRMERNRQKLVGRDKGSLTEWQTKGTVTTTIQIRRKHNTNRTTQRAALPDCRCRVLPRRE